MAEDAEGVEAARRVREPGGSSPGKNSPNRGEEVGKKSDGDSDRADSPAPPTGKEDGSVADSEDSGVLVEAPVEREK